MKRIYGVAPALILILLATVVFAPVPGDTRWLRTLHNSAHAPIFGCIALLALIAVHTHPRLRLISLFGKYLLALATVFLLGAATEILQIPAGRDASVEDALHDIIGALAFLGVFAMFDPGVRAVPRSHLIRTAAGIVAAVSLATAAAPVTRAAIKYQQRDQRFPVIADFSQYYDRYFVLQRAAEFSPVTVPNQWATAAAESALRVRFLDGEYPGMEFIELLPDWSGYSTLAVDLINPTPLNLQLALRVHDAMHTNQPADRFSKRVELPAGTRKVIRIPLQEIAAGPRTRTLDLRRITGVIVFRTQDSPPAGEMYLSKAWLE